MHKEREREGGRERKKEEINQEGMQKNKLTGGKDEKCKNERGTKIERQERALGKGGKMQEHGKTKE